MFIWMFDETLVCGSNFLLSLRKRTSCLNSTQVSTSKWSSYVFLRNTYNILQTVFMCQVPSCASDTLTRYVAMQCQYSRSLKSAKSTGMVHSTAPRTQSQRASITLDCTLYYFTPPFMKARSGLIKRGYSETLSNSDYKGIFFLIPKIYLPADD